MAPTESVCFETDIRSTEVPDVLTIYSIFWAVLCHLQKVFRTRSISDILVLVEKQEKFFLAVFLKILYFGHVQAFIGGCKRDLKRSGKIWLSFKRFVDTKKDKLFSPCYDFLLDVFRREMLKSPLKQDAVDRFAICTWFLVQQYEKDQCEKRKSILKNMISVTPDDVDRTLTEIVYYSKMATTAEFENDIETAKDFASKAKYLSEIYYDKTAKILSHYSYFFLHRRLYLRDKTETNKRSVLEQCNIGCNMFPIPNEDGEFEMYCALLFLLYKAGDFLHITYEFEVLDYDKMGFSNTSIMAAEEVLKSATRYIPISTPRKKLTFKYCMGRLCHLQSEFKQASKYLNETKEMMKDGVLNEKEQTNVHRYCARFEEELRWENCINQDDETAKETAMKLTAGQQYHLGQQMLHKILEKFGRKNEITLRLCDDLCRYIKSKNDKIVHIFPSYSVHYDKEVIFVIFVKDLLSKTEEDEIGYTIKQRLIDEFSPEGKDVMNDKRASEVNLTPAERKKVVNCIHTHATGLMERHKYLSIITPGSVRSKGYGTHEFTIQEEPCIVLYVYFKDCIPLDEDPFQKTYDAISVDVREGVFVTHHGQNGPLPNEYHEQLRMGCCISGPPNNEGLAPSVGSLIIHSTAYVDLHVHMLYCILRKLRI